MLDNQSHPITIQELRECHEFAGMDDYTAQEIIDTIQDFCAIIANQYEVLSDE